MVLLVVVLVVVVVTRVVFPPPSPAEKSNPVSVLTDDPSHRESGGDLDCCVWAELIVVNGDARKRKRSPSAVEHGTKEKRLSTARTKETPEQIQWRQFMDKLLIVLERYTRILLMLMKS